MSNIEIAIKIALEAHSMQVDKSGSPYILHPLRLMFRCNTNEEMIVAILHDVIEDSETTIETLQELGFSTAILNAVDCLTRRNGEDYKTFIKRVSSNDLAKKIKIIDLQDNLDITRLKRVSDKDIARIKKYHESLEYLNSSFIEK